MIPKLIHYIWVGDISKMPDQQKKYIEEWSKIMPNYKIIFWDYENYIKVFGIDEICVCFRFNETYDTF